MFQYQAIAINSNGQRETVTLHHEALNVAAINFDKHFPGYVLINWVNQVGEAVVDEAAIKEEIAVAAASVGHTAEFYSKWEFLGTKQYVRLIDSRKRCSAVYSAFKWGELQAQIQGFVKAEKFNQQLSGMVRERMTA